LAVLHPHRLWRDARRITSSLVVRCPARVGASTARIVFLHILPNFTVAGDRACHHRLGFTILVAAVLGFLGMGATPPARFEAWPSPRAAPTYRAPGVRHVPGLAILITVMGFNLLGDGLRHIVDPRIRRSR